MINYKLLYSNDGKLTAIHDDQGRQLIFYPGSKTFDETHYLTKKLRESELSASKKLSLDDVSPIRTEEDLGIGEELLSTEQIEIIKDKDIDKKLNYLIAQLNKPNSSSDISKLEQQINLNQKTTVDILTKLTDLAIAADDSPDLNHIKELIKTLSQAVAVLAGDMDKLKSETSKAANVEELFAKLKVAIEQSKKDLVVSPSTPITPVEKPKPKVESVSFTLELFGSGKLTNGIYEITNPAQLWKAGFRSLIPIENSGEYFEYRIKGKGIIGVTAFPKAKNAWDNTQYAYYHTSDTSVSQFINNAHSGQKSVIAINQLMRFAIDPEKFFLWQTKEDGQNEYITLFKSQSPLYSGVFLFGTPAIAAQVSDFKIGKIQ